MNMNDIKDLVFQVYTYNDTEGIFINEKGIDTRSLIVFVHGFNRFGAWELLWQTRRFVANGYAVFLPSQTGFGGSLGERDYCGPNTVDRMYDLITFFEEKSGQSFVKTIVWGASRGALVATSLLVKDNQLFDAGILQAGIYDFRADYEWEDKNEEMKKNIGTEAGLDEKSFVSRSPIFKVDEIQCPLLLMHGVEDDIISCEQTKMFSKALASAGKDYEMVLLENQGHQISSPVNNKKYVYPFLEKILST